MGDVRVEKAETDDVRVEGLVISGITDGTVKIGGVEVDPESDDES